MINYISKIRKKSLLIVLLFILCMASSASAENIKLRVVAVNPSETENKTTPIKIYLPEEVTPGDIIDQGNLFLEYDSARKIYYIFSDNVELTPKETKIFEIVIRDVWMIPDDELNALKIRTARILDSLIETDYYEKASLMADTIYERLMEINVGQSDESLSRELHIGLYRTNLKVVERIRKDIDKLEKLLIYIGGPPAPEMLEESSLKMDQPSTTTTWLIIFIIMGFVGVLGLVFFFTWNKQSKMTDDIMRDARKTAFSEDFEMEEEEVESEKDNEIS